MALIVEDGTIKAGADAYVDTAYADAYHSDRQNAAWAAATSPAKEAAIRVATQYLDGRYRTRLKGRKLQALQARQWPRWGVTVDTGLGFAREQYDEGFTHGLIPSSIVPDPVKQATCEAALRALSGPLAQDLPRGGQIRRQKGVISETEYFPGASPHTVYEILDLILGDFLVPADSCELVRG